MLLKNIRNNQKGQALVELALILPILLLLVFGLIEFGRIFGTHLIITHSAREGARAASVGATDTEIVELVRNRSSAFVVDPSKLIIEVFPSQNLRRRGDGVKVEVKYPVRIYAPIVSSIVNNPYNAKAEVIMRVE